MLPGDNLRERKIPLNYGSGLMPALGFGTLIPDPVTTRNATKAALQTGFRLLDTAERYRTEKEANHIQGCIHNAATETALKKSEHSILPCGQNTFLRRS